MPKLKNIDYGKVLGKEEQNILKLIYSFYKYTRTSNIKNEPSILARYLIDIAKAFSSFYNENKIIVEDKVLQDARIYLAYATGIVLKNGAKLLGIDMPEKM